MLKITSGIESKTKLKKETFNSWCYTRLFSKLTQSWDDSVIVFGQMLSGHQVCSPSPPFFRSTQYYWSESERKMMSYWWSNSQTQPRALSNPDMNDDSAWHSSGTYMRADVWWHLLGSFLCLLFWSSALWSERLCYVSALRLSAESSSVRLRTPPLSFYLRDDVDRLFISKSKTQYCL